MTVSAHLAGDYETYANRLRLITNIPKEKFASCLTEMDELGRTLRAQAAKAMEDALIARGSPEETTALRTALRLLDQATEVTTAVTGIDAYLTGISMYAQPERYLGTDKGTWHLLDVIDPNTEIHQNGLAPLVRNLLHSVDSDLPLNQVKQVAATIGCYTSDELEIYLTQLAKLPNDLPFALRMGNGEHSISLSRGEKGWVLTDPKKLPELHFSSKQLPAIAHALRWSLKHKGGPMHTLISAELYVNAKNLSRAQSKINSIQSKPTWQLIHKITEEKAGFDAFINLAKRDNQHKTIVKDIFRISKLDLSRELLLMSGEPTKIDLALSLLNNPRTNPNYIAAGYTYLKTPLAYACYAGNLRLVKALLDDPRTKVDVDLQYRFTHKNWSTPEGKLHQAVIEKRIKKLAQQPTLNTTNMPIIALNPEREAALAAVKLDGVSLKNFPAFKDDEEIVTAAYQQNIVSLAHAGESLKNRKFFMLQVVQHTGWAILYASPRLKDDFEVAHTAVACSEIAYKYVGDHLKGKTGANKEAVKLTMLAVQSNGTLLEHASSDLQNNKNIVRAAVISDPTALRYASENLQKDKGFLLKLIKQKPEVFSYISDQIKDRSFVLKAVTKIDNALLYAPGNFKNDPSFLLELMEKNSNFIGQIQTTMPNYTQFMLDYFAKNSDKFELIPKNLRNNGVFMIDLIRCNQDALNYVSTELKQVKIFGLALAQLRAQGYLDAEELIDEEEQNEPVHIALDATTALRTQIADDYQLKRDKLSRLDFSDANKDINKFLTEWTQTLIKCFDTQIEVFRSPVQYTKEQIENVKGINEQKIKHILDDMVIASQKIPKTTGFAGLINRIFECCGFKCRIHVNKRDVQDQVNKMKVGLQEFKDSTLEDDTIQPKGLSF